MHSYIRTLIAIGTYVYVAVLLLMLEHEVVYAQVTTLVMSDINNQ